MAGIDEKLLLFAESPTEKKYLETMIEGNSQRATAQIHGVSKNSVNEAVNRVQMRALQRGYQPDFDMNIPAAEGYHVKGTSTLYDPRGNIKQQWVKTNKDKEELLSLMKEAVESIIEPSKGLFKPIKPPTNTNDSLMTVYPVAEPHMGLYTWDEESGADYDVKIAEELLTSSMAELVDSAPASEECLIVNLADYFHADSMENKTMRSGNVLDVDTRWGKVFRVGVRAHRNIINMALQKHKKVYVKSGIGNHDDHSIFCLMMLMQAYFEKEERVTIDLPINPFAYHTFGKNLIGIHHGDIKHDRLPLIMATDKPEEWGDAMYRTFLYGHIHHKQVKEHPGCITESFRSIAAKDAWHNRSGYRSSRAMEAIILSKDGGEHGRRTVNI